MSGGRLYLAGGLAVMRRDLQLFLSYRLRVFGQLAAIFLSLTLFYYVSRLVNAPRFRDPDAYFAYVVVGLIILELLTASLSTTPLSVRNELLTGTFERLVVSPLGPVGSAVAMCAFPVLLAFMVGAVTIALAALIFGLPLNGATTLLGVPAAFLGALAFLPLALLTIAVVLVLKQAGTATVFIVTGLSLSSGAFFPVALLPGWVRPFSEVQPLTPALELLRHLMLGAALPRSAWIEVAKLVACFVVLTPLSLAMLHATVRAARRRGTLIEY